MYERASEEEERLEMEREKEGERTDGRTWMDRRERESEYEPEHYKRASTLMIY